MKDIKGTDIEVGQQAIFIDTRCGTINSERVTITKIGEKRISGSLLGEKWNRVLNRYVKAQVTLVRIPSHVIVL